MPPSPIARPGIPPGGSAPGAPARRIRASSCAGPTASSSVTAGTFSERCSASRTLTVPWYCVIEIRRRPVPEGDRPVIDQAFGMRNPELEGEPVDQRLERRARRAHRLGHVDPARAAGVEQAGRADAGDDLARARGRRPAARPRRRAAGCRRDRRAAPRAAPGQAGVEGQTVHRSRPGGNDPVGKVRRQRRERRGARSGPTRACAARASPSARAPSATARASTRSRAARAASASRSGRRASGDCGSATSSAASAGVRRRGSLPNQIRLAARTPSTLPPKGASVR